ncbi:hypothetical protein D918_01736 [Trichuris suis]|nr:hypothetical protein D918_01736 [Trichuris suis]
MGDVSKLKARCSINHSSAAAITSLAKSHFYACVCPPYGLSKRLHPFLEKTFHKRSSDSLPQKP